MHFARLLRHAALLLCIFVCLTATAQEAAPKKRIVVLNFDDPGAGTLVDTQEVGRGVSVQLIQKLLQGSKYTVVDRSMVVKLLAEQNASSDSDPDDAYTRAAKIGRMLSLDAMIIGAVTRYGPDDKDKDAGGGRGMFSSGGHKRKSKAYVEVTARVLNMTNAEILGGFAATGESSRSGEVMRINGRGKAPASTEMLGNEFVDVLFGEATHNAVEQLAGQLNAFAEKIPTLRIAMEGLVADVAGNTVTLTVGRKSGAKLGDKFAIVRDVKAIIDPGTVQALQPPPEVIGEAVVTEVSDDAATATFSGAGQPQVGDHARSVDKERLTRRY